MKDLMIAKRFEERRKPRKCPACGASPVASILWGEPAFTPELEKKMEEGRVSLGGCCIPGDPPMWTCTKCNIEIYKLGSGTAF